MTSLATPLSRPSRILVVGNGPTLAGQVEDLSKWDGDVFCCNRFSQWRRAPFVPDYYVCSQHMVERGVEPENPPYKKRLFRSSYMKISSDTFTPVLKGEFPFLVPGCQEAHVRTDMTQAGVMVQLSAWMGYTYIVMVGVEQRGSRHVFDEEGQVGKAFEPPSDRPEAFSLWSKMAKHYRDIGVTVVDSTPGGRLNDVVGYVPLAQHSSR